MLGKALGLYLIFVSGAMIVHPRRTLATIDEMAASGPWMLFSGLVAVAVGLGILVCGPGWRGLSASLVTIFGIAALLKGLALLFLPGEAIASVYERGGLTRNFRAWMAAALLLGLLTLWAS